MSTRVFGTHGTSSLPRTVIQPGSRWMAFDLREIWRNRELLYFFIWRDLKVRYKQTAFGALWALIQPLSLMLVFSLFLGNVEGIAPQGVPYSLFTLVALVPWTLFSQSLIGSSDSLVGAANILQKVYFPRVLLPIAAVGSYIVDFLIGMVMLLVFMVVMGVIPTLASLWVVPLTVLAVLASLAFGIWLSAVNVRYRDVRYAVPFLVQVWLFASPVAYSAAAVPEELRVVYSLNPMAGVIEGFRWALLEPSAAPPLGAIALSVAVTGLVLATGLLYFRRVERTFADVI
jgi:lipopolysaccharide transport system permease protein